MFYYADWLAYLGLGVCSVLKALIGKMGHSADAVAYLDLSDAIRDHRWHALVNGYWFPGYPAVLTVGRALLGFRARYELMAARLITMLTGLLFVLASIALAWSIRRLMLSRGVEENELLPPRVLYLWVAAFSYFLALEDLAALTPDALVSAFMILSVASLIWTRADGGLMAYVCVGFFAACAFWTKTFAFPFFVLVIVFSLIADMPRFRRAPRLAISLLVFALIAGPFVYWLSADKGRLTFGDTGRLNLLWFESRSDIFNPVADSNVCHTGTAKGNFKHPGELLARSPRIAYFGAHGIQGSTPQWDAPSYWWDGMIPSFNSRDVVARLRQNLKMLFSILVMRVQIIIFVAAICAYGYSFRRRSLVDLIWLTMLLIALACVGLYAAVLLEGRYIAFALVMIGVLFAGAALTGQGGLQRSLHVAVLLMFALVLVDGIQTSLREWKSATLEGSHPLQGIYDMPVLSAGAQLASQFAPGTEVACMGDKACWLDPYWAKYGGVSITAIIETGMGWDSVSAESGCEKLQQNLSALNPLRERHVRAIVARFDGPRPCSTEWRPLGQSPDFFYLPL